MIKKDKKFWRDYYRDYYYNVRKPKHGKNPDFKQAPRWSKKELHILIKNRDKPIRKLLILLPARNKYAINSRYTMLKIKRPQFATNTLKTNCKICNIKLTKHNKRGGRCKNCDNKIKSAAQKLKRQKLKETN